MNNRTLAKPKNRNSATFSPEFRKKLSGRSFMPQFVNEARDVSNPEFGHNFGDVQVESPSFKQSCPIALSGPAHCPYGGACHTCPPLVQAKLKIGQPGDKYEQEADRVAEQVMRMPEPQVQRKACTSCNENDEEELIQAKPVAGRITPLVQKQEAELEEEDEEKILQTKEVPGQTPEVIQDMQTNINNLRGSGKSLSESERSFFEPRFGYDFSQVRVHSGSQAEQLTRTVNARALTVGRDVVFGAGQYPSGTVEGQRLLSHELAHTIQQSGTIQQDSKILRIVNKEDSSELETNATIQSIILGKPPKTLMPTGIRIARQPNKPAARSGKSNPVVSIRINKTSGKVVFNLASGQKYHGTVTTDLEPGSYSIIPNIAKKKWFIPGTDPGLRFYVELEGADPWALTYPKRPSLEVIKGGKEDLPVEQTFNVKDTVPIKGDPMSHSNYIQNVIRGVGIFGWGGPFRLDRKIVNGMGANSIYLPRNEAYLSSDPLKGSSGAINLVYKSRVAAEAALSSIGLKGTYTFYIGRGGHIYPTSISDTTAPALCAALRKALEVERTDAKAAQKLSVDLLLWYVGARYPIKTGKPAQAVKPSKGISIPATGSAAGTVASGGSKPLVFIEIGAGDLKAAIELAKKGGVKVIAVDPAGAPAVAIREIEALGGTFIKGTAESLSSNTAHHVFQYFPWKIEGTGRLISGGTWRLVEDTMKLLKPNGAAHFVTEDVATANFLAKEASTRGLKAVITETTAGAAAPGASGASVPNFTSTLKVWLVNIYK